MFEWVRWPCCPQILFRGLLKFWRNYVLPCHVRLTKLAIECTDWLTRNSPRAPETSDTCKIHVTWYLDIFSNLVLRTAYMQCQCHRSVPDKTILCTPPTLLRCHLNLVLIHSLNPARREERVELEKCETKIWIPGINIFLVKLAPEPIHGEQSGRNSH